MHQAPAAQPMAQAPASQPAAAIAPQPALPCEKMVYYSIAFINNPMLLDKFESFEPNLSSLEGLSVWKADTLSSARDFLAMHIDKQRELFLSKEKEVKKQLEGYLRACIEIIRHNNASPMITQYLIFLLDGILEDDKDRISVFVTIQKDKKNKEDIVAALKSFIVSGDQAGQETRDVSAHILTQLLVCKDLKGMEEEMKTVLNLLCLTQTEKGGPEKKISSFGFSSALRHLLKDNEVLR